MCGRQLRLSGLRRPARGPAFSVTARRSDIWLVDFGEDKVDFALDEAGDAVRVEPVRDHPTLRGSLAGLGLVAELEADHRSEARR
jgi:hypothetical protein